MAELRRNGPYIWVTWLTKLLVGENSCEWGAWFRTQHEGGSWGKVPSTFDLTTWQMGHTARLNDARESLETQGYTVFTENQNSFVLRGQTAALGGKPDLIARRGSSGLILDVKTGRSSPSHGVQVITYMWATPLALRQYKGISFDGRVIYKDYEVEIPSRAVDDQFVQNLASLIQRLSAPTPARKVPNPMECGFCDITQTDCPQRTADEFRPDGETKAF